MDKTEQRPKVIEYTNYRKYLADLFLWKQSQSNKFTHLYCAKKLKTAKSYLSQVFKQQIHVTLNRAGDFSKLFGLSDFEKQYFVVLLIKGQLADPELMTHFSGILERLKNNEEIAGLRDYRNKAKLSVGQKADWLSQAIGGMTNFAEFQWDAKWIQNHLSESVSEEEINKTLKEMLESKMIRREGGRYIEESAHHSPEPFEINSHRRYIPGAVKAIEVLNGDLQFNKPALFFSGALPISKNDFLQLAESYYQFIQKAIALSENSENPDRVIFMSNNIFHVTK